MCEDMEFDLKGKDLLIKEIYEQINKNQKETKKLIGWVVKAREKIIDNKYGINIDEEYEICHAVGGKVVLMDVKSKKYYIDLSYLKKNFELVCYMD